MPRKEIGTAWDRDSRNSMNENFRELYNFQGKAIEVATQKTIDASKLNWQEPVETYNDIATAYATPEVGFTVMTRDTGKVFRYDIENFWKEIHNIDPTVINEVDTRLTAQLAQSAIVVSKVEPLDAGFWYEDKGEAPVDFNADSGISVQNATVSTEEPLDTKKLWFDI